jgi:hypothetical protein
MVGVDGCDLPIGLYVARAHPQESQVAEATLASLRVAPKRGRPASCSKELLADKAFYSQEFRQHLRRRRIKPTIRTF